MSAENKWTKIDPAIHTPEWFRGKGVTFLHDNSGSSAYVAFTHTISPPYARYFFLHPPLPDPIEEEIESEARNYAKAHSSESHWMLEHNALGLAFIAGARAFLGRQRT